MTYKKEATKTISYEKLQELILEKEDKCNYNGIKVQKFMGYCSNCYLALLSNDLSDLNDDKFLCPKCGTENCREVLKKEKALKRVHKNQLSWLKDTYHVEEKADGYIERHSRKNEDNLEFDDMEHA